MMQLDDNRVRNMFQTSKYKYYRSSNSLESPIVFLSGLFAGDWIWEATLSQLQEKDASFIVLQEPLASIGSTVEALREYLKAILDELNIYRCTLVGNSYGGLLALDMAARFPERIKSIVVSGSPGLGSTTSVNGGTMGVRTFSRELAMEIAKQLFYDQSQITEEMLNRTLVTFSNSTIILNTLRLLKAERKYDTRTILSLIECETLLLWGEKDAVTPLAEWERSQSLLKKGSLKVIAACGHAAMIEKPAQFHSILWEFLTAHGSIEERQVPVCIDTTRG